MIDALYSARQLKECERKACLELNTTEAELMNHAGESAFMLLKKHYPLAKKIIIFCGGGKNAGDGYVLARLAKNKGFLIHINQYKLACHLPNPACSAAIIAQQNGVSCQHLIDPHDFEADVIVDALLGIGLKGDVREPLLSAINQINESNLPVLSLDIPSGLNADTGRVMGVCVKASATLSFIGPKQGMYTLDGPDQCGLIFQDDLSIGSSLASVEPGVSCLAAPSFKNRLKNSHKHQFGHVLIVGGNEGMLGAVQLAAKAALRAGAGMVSIATHPVHANQGFSGLPEAMVYGIEQKIDLQHALDSATVCVIGPGLGDDAWARQLFEQVISSHLPMIIDAGALRLLAEAPQRDDNWLLTPHPGEAASLLECTTDEIQENRFSAVKHLQDKFGGTVILKGRGTLIASDAPLIYLCAQGNPGMATAGMGDVLSGITAGLAAQGFSLVEAAKAGVWLHASACDAVARNQGERGMIASDIFSYLQRLVNN